MTSFTKQHDKCRAIIDEALEDLHHVLSWQAPIKDFVHRNILQGLEQEHFVDALKKVNKLTGAQGFMPIEDYRSYYQQGRITEVDLEFVLKQDKSLNSETKIANSQISYADIYKIALLKPLKH